MPVLKSINMSLNTRKQRSYLYSQTFLKWKVEQRLSTLQKTAIESSLAIHKFGNNATQEGFKKLCESLSDFETMLEVIEETFPALRSEMDLIKKEKLTVLKKQNVLNNQAKKLEGKAEEKKKKSINIPEIIKMQTEQKLKPNGIRKLFDRN